MPQDVVILIIAVALLGLYAVLDIKAYVRENREKAAAKPKPQEEREATCQTCQWFGQAWDVSPCVGCTRNPVKEHPHATDCYFQFPGRSEGRNV